MVMAPSLTTPAAVASVPKEPTERSPLLGNGTSKSWKEVSEPFPNGILEAGAAGDSNTKIDRARDEEAGEGEEENNPPFDGLPEVAAQLHWLVPAIGIGVSEWSLWYKLLLFF